MMSAMAGTGRIIMDMMKMTTPKSRPAGYNRRVPQKASAKKPGASFQRKLSPREMTIKFAKDLLSQGQHTHHRLCLEQICGSLSGSGQSNLMIHLTPSPLSSASLLSSYFKHKLIRNQESVTSSTIRKILSVADSRNPLWNHSTSQIARKLQFSQTMDKLLLQREALELKSSFSLDDSCIRSQLVDLDNIIRKTQTMIEFLDPLVRGNLHPDSLLAEDKVSLTPTEMANLPSPSGTIRGILIRVKGPRKGNRAIKQQKSCGRVSINSVDYVTQEECKIQLPSKLGIYGLYVRIVYSKAERLISPNVKLPVFNAPDFKFKLCR